MSMAIGGKENVTRGIVKTYICEDLTNHTQAERKASKRIELLSEDNSDEHPTHAVLTIKIESDCLSICVYTIFNMVRNLT